MTFEPMIFVFATEHAECLLKEIRKCMRVTEIRFELSQNIFESTFTCLENRLTHVHIYTFLPHLFKLQCDLVFHAILLLTSNTSSRRHYFCLKNSTDICTHWHFFTFFNRQHDFVFQVLLLTSKRDNEHMSS